VAGVFFFALFVAAFFAAGLLGLLGADWGVDDPAASALADCAAAGVANAEKPDARMAIRVKSFRLNRIRRRWATTLFN
jgi:hypothetical protein